MGLGLHIRRVSKRLFIHYPDLLFTEPFTSSGDHDVSYSFNFEQTRVHLRFSPTVAVGFGRRCSFYASNVDCSRRACMQLLIKAPGRSDRQWHRGVHSVDGKYWHVLNTYKVLTTFQPTYLYSSVDISIQSFLICCQSPCLD